MVTYDLDDDDDDDDFILARPTNKPGGNSMVNRAMGRTPSGKLDLTAGPGGGSVISPYVRGGLVEKATKDSSGVALREEHLGDDFLETPWRIPSIDKAQEYRASQVFLEGNVHPMQINMSDVQELGTGLRMYFHFTKSICVGLVFMTLFCLPLLGFAYYGTAIPVEDQDTAGLYQYSLGNLGDLYPKICEQRGMKALNETCVEIAGMELLSTEVSLIVTFSELLQVIVFLIVIWHLRRRFWKYNNLIKSNKPLSITNYAVYVENLPPHVTEADLIEHFSTLYQLEKFDWRNRPPVEDARPVQSCDNTGNPIHTNTWIAECTIYRKIGKFLKLYREKEQIVEALYRNRAKMKMYAYDTAHEDGPNDKLYSNAEKAMLKVANYIDYFTLKIKDTVQYVVEKGVKARNKSLAKWQKKQQRLNPHKVILPPPSSSSGPEVVVVPEKASSSSWWGCFAKKQTHNMADYKADDNNTSTSAIVVHTGEQVRGEAEGAVAGADIEVGVDGVVGKKGDIEEDNVVTIFQHDEHNPEDKEPSAGHKSTTHSNNHSQVASPRPTSASSSAMDKGETLPDPISIVSNVVNDAKPIGAFVCFEYNESFARCMEDYRKYSSFPYNLLYPKHLLLHGRRLKVSTALEPDLLIVENLEISKTTKFLLKTRTFCLTALLMIICFIVILGAAISKTIYSDSIPSDYLCTQDLPAIYAGPRFVDKDYINSLTLIRPPLMSAPVTLIDIDGSETIVTNPLREVLDQNCSAIIPNSFYAVYAENGKFSRPSANYSVDACPNPTEQHLLSYNSSLSYCPVYQSSQYCPCITTVVQQDCATFSCQKSLSSVPVTSSSPAKGVASDDTSQCRSDQGSYDAKDLVYCYCKQGFHKLLSTDNMWKFVSSFINSGQPPDPKELAGEDGAYCGDFQGVYMSSYLLNYGAVVVTVLINRLLRLLLLTLSKYEGHVSLDDLNYSIFIKMLITTYINMAVIVLLAFGISPSFDTMPPTIYKGIYTDFKRSWFSSIGFYLITTFLFTAYIPVFTKYMHFKIVFPLKKYFAKRKIKDKKGHNIFMQHDLNKCEVGEMFDYTQHVAQVMALLFFMMTYAPGIPLLTPLMMVLTFAYFSMDKILLLRYHRKPPVSNDRIMKTIVYYCLPLAVIIRLCFAIYMFSSTDNILATTFPTYGGYNYDLRGQFNVEVISLKNYEDYVMQEIVQPQPYYIPFTFLNFLEDRVKQSNVFPLFVLLIIVLLCIVGEYVFNNFIYPMWHTIGIILRLTWKYLCCCCKSKNINMDKLSKQELYLQVASKERGYIQPYNLLTMKDPLRQEVAPFTGIYYQFIGRKKDRNLKMADGKDVDLEGGEGNTGCCSKLKYMLCCQCFKCCRRKKSRKMNQVAVLNGDNPALDMVNMDDVLDIEASSKSAKKIKGYDVNGGWEITEMGLDFEVKVKVWSTTGLGPDGVLRNKGQHKRTFEVLADNHCHSYQLQFLPNYKLAYLALRDQEGYLLVDDYLKRRSEWQGIRKFKPKEAEAKMMQELVEHQLDAIRDKETEETQEKLEKERRIKALTEGEDEKKEEGDGAGEGDESEAIKASAKAGGFLGGLFRTASSKDAYSLVKDEPPAKQETKERQASSSEEESSEEDSDDDDDDSDEDSDDDSDDSSYEDSDDSDK